jgi:hypothetical protein
MVEGVIFEDGFLSVDLFLPAGRGGDRPTYSSLRDLSSGSSCVGKWQLALRAG